MDLDARGLWKAHPGAPVLSGLDLAVPSGERVAVLGPSGTGKTTLLRLLAGLDLPDAGEIRLGGELVTGAGVDVPPHRRGVALVFQFPALWPHMTVLDNVLFGSAAPDRARATALLDELALEGLGGRYPDQVSGGQAKRIALARALAAQRPLLLLDEPLTHVEPAMREMLLERVLAHAAADGATLVYVTHDPAEAAHAADRLLTLRDGRLVDAAAPTERPTSSPEVPPP
jgi:ABC-type sulfate/molybdate transport systems ATPase subunit